MIFDTAEMRCVLSVLETLNKGKSKYTSMFKETKVSHTTLQTVFKKLTGKDFIKKHDVGHMKVDYEITEKGREFLKKLKDIRNFLN